MYSKLPFLYDIFLYKQANFIFLQLKQFILQNMNYNINIFFGGSCAKQTSLDYKELDIFVELNDICFENYVKDLFALFKNFNYVFKYSSHPYITLFYKNFTIDVVPCMKYIENSTIKTPVDRSIKHVLFVNKNLYNKYNVVCLKEILKKNYIYGAETYIAGVSGYTCEIIFATNNLNNLNKTKTFFNFEKIIDPVDKKRNILACTSKSNIFKLNEVLYKFRGSVLRNLNFNLYLKQFEKGLKLIFISSTSQIDKHNKSLKQLKQKLTNYAFTIHITTFKEISVMSFIETTKLRDVVLISKIGPNYKNVVNFSKFLLNDNTYWSDNGLCKDTLVDIDLITMLKQFANIEVIIDYINCNMYLPLIKLHYIKKYGPL